MRSGFIIRLLSLGLTLSLFSAPLAPIANAIPTRSLTDRTDDLQGPQIHLIYTIPGDAEDKNWDTNGQIKKWIDQGQDWLFLQVSRKLRYDTFQSDLDISFLKSSLSLSQMRSKISNRADYKDALLPFLMREFLAQSPNRNYKASPKTYLFLSSENLSSELCGYAYNFTAMGFGFAGGDCWRGPVDDTTTPYGMAWPAKTVIHEVFHAFGVDHICDSKSDLMWGKPECEGDFNYAPINLDQDRRDYFGADKGGVDISQLPIWQDGSGSSQYAQVKAIKTYIPYSGADWVFTIGDPFSAVSWDWQRIDGLREGGLLECTLNNGKVTITAKIDNFRCVFEIPLNWRGGVTATLTGKIWTGPYYGEVIEKVKIWNPDNYYSACLKDLCFAGESIEIRSNFCYLQDSKTFTLQQFVDGSWKSITTSPTRPRLDCSQPSWEPVPVNYTFSKAEKFTFRWVESDTATTRGFTEPIRVITVLDSNANYPVEVAKSAIDKEAEAIAAEAARKAELEKLARDLYERQLMQCATSGTNCYVGESFIVPSICFATDVGELQLEILTNNVWELVTRGPVKTGSPKCSASSFGSPAHSMIFKEPGVIILRWATPADSKFTYRSEPIGILIMNKSDGEPSTNQLDQARATAQALSQEAERIATEAAARARAEAEAAAQAKAAAAAQAKAAAEAAAKKKKTITCIKGKSVKKVTGVNPVCPKGFKKK
jgi:hypothetical protein